MQNKQQNLNASPANLTPPILIVADHIVVLDIYLFICLSVYREWKGGRILVIEKGIGNIREGTT